MDQRAGSSTPVGLTVSRLDAQPNRHLSLRDALLFQLVSPSAFCPHSLAYPAPSCPRACCYLESNLTIVCAVRTSSFLSPFRFALCYFNGFFIPIPAMRRAGAEIPHQIAFLFCRSLYFSPSLLFGEQGGGQEEGGIKKYKSKVHSLQPC